MKNNQKPPKCPECGHNKNVIKKTNHPDPPAQESISDEVVVGGVYADDLPREFYYCTKHLIEVE